MSCSQDIDKHKKDVFKLFSIANPSSRVEVKGTVRAAVERFLDEIIIDPYDPKEIYEGITKAEIVELMRRMYLLDIPNVKTKEAINETEKMKEDTSLGKTYTDIDSMMKDLLE